MRLVDEDSADCGGGGGGGTLPLFAGGGGGGGGTFPNLLDGAGGGGGGGGGGTFPILLDGAGDTGGGGGTFLLEDGVGDTACILFFCCLMLGRFSTFRDPEFLIESASLLPLFGSAGGDDLGSCAGFGEVVLIDEVGFSRFCSCFNFWSEVAKGCLLVVEIDLLASR